GAASHVALLRRPLDFEHPAACRRRAAAGRHACAQPARRTYPATNPALTRRFRGTATSVSPPDGEESRKFHLHSSRVRTYVPKLAGRIHVGVIAAAVGRTLALAGQPEVRCGG